MKKMIFPFLLLISFFVNAKSVQYSVKDLYGDWHCQIEHKEHNAKVLADYRLHKNGTAQIFSMFMFPTRTLPDATFLGVLYYSYAMTGKWALVKNDIIIDIKDVIKVQNESNYLAKQEIERNAELKQIAERFVEQIKQRKLSGITDKQQIQIKSFEKEDKVKDAIMIANNKTQGFCTRPLNPAIWSESFKQVFP
ncbi:hypothetical protein [Gallibacterium anatis]|uniref:hypothetical protein n=1 Tax=Gallibacterium anatis TaxID=750 RepID=UPI00254C9B1B|nr:hypothetical protein [Gallibacterium anatis]WIM82153.1 hypothetical protein QP019_00270 [Gallibacterium anatis]